MKFKEKKTLESLEDRFSMYKATNEDIDSEKDDDHFFIGDDDEEHQKVVKMIGEEATSVCYKIYDEHLSEYLCKKVVKVKDDHNEFKRLQNSMKEIEVLLRIKHLSICRAVGVNTQERVTTKGEFASEEKEDDDEENEKTTVEIFLEYIPFNLNDILKSDMMSSTLKMKITLEVAFGMAHLHSMGMIHRDLKMYIFEAKIIGFDLIHVGEEVSLSKGVVTLNFMSPENTEQRGLQQQYPHLVVRNFSICNLNKKEIGLPLPLSSISSACISIIKKIT